MPSFVHLNAAACADIGGSADKWGPEVDAVSEE